MTARILLLAGLLAGSAHAQTLWCGAATCPAQAPAVPPATETWTGVAGENGAFTAAGRIRYGAGAQWTEQTLTGPATCSNVAFGDPAWGRYKSCFALVLPVAPAPPPPPPPPVSPPVPVLGTLQCLPKTFGGTGTALATVAAPGGRAWWWLCADKLNVVPVLDEFTPACASPMVEIVKAFSPTAPLASINSLIKACGFEPAPVSAQGVRMAALREAARVAAVAALVPAVWVVSKNAAVTTRPAYWVAADALVPTQPAVRATVGDVCDCAKPFIKGSSTYCNIPPLSVTVFALCVKK